MNIHPLFVHFPIALLTVYSALEIIAYAWPSIRRRSWLFPVNAFLLFVGVLAAFAALITGNLAQGYVADGPRAFILEVHSPFALATTLVYLLLAAAYLIRLFEREGWWDHMASSYALLGWIWRVKKSIAHIVLDTGLLSLLALLGLIGMSVTGALGAAMVYGSDVDPFVTFVYRLFWAN